MTKQKHEYIRKDELPVAVAGAILVFLGYKTFTETMVLVSAQTIDSVVLPYIAAGLVGVIMFIFGVIMVVYPFIRKDG